VPSAVGEPAAVAIEPVKTDVVAPVSVRVMTSGVVSVLELDSEGD